MSARTLLFAFLLAGSACGFDHQTVATVEVFDAQGGAEPLAATDTSGGVTSSSGGNSVGGNNSVGGTNSVGGSFEAAAGASTLGGADLGLGGSDGSIHIGNGGATDYVVRCACLDSGSSACGTDGMNYDATCTGSDCFPVAIACWHACPCSDDELNGTISSSLWFSESCLTDVPCGENVNATCLGFPATGSNVPPDNCGKLRP